MKRVYVIDHCDRTPAIEQPCVHHTWADFASQSVSVQEGIVVDWDSRRLSRQRILSLPVRFPM